MEGLRVDKACLPHWLSERFKNCYRVFPGQASFSLAFGFSLMFSVAKHRKSEKGVELFNRAVDFMQPPERFTYLKQLLTRFRNFDENFASESLEHLIRTEGALKSLHESTSLFIKILSTNPENSPETSTEDLSEAHLERLSKSLNITLLIISNEKFLHFNAKDENLMIWTFQENSSFFIVLSKLGLQSEDFPFTFHEEKKTETNPVKNPSFFYFHVKNVENELKSERKIVQIDFFNSENVDFLAFTTAVMHSLLENKDFCEVFIKKFGEICSQFQELEGDVIIKFFLDFLVYLNALQERFDVENQLNLMNTQFEYFCRAFQLLGFRLFERASSLKDEKMSFYQILKLFPTVLNISIAVYKERETEMFSTYFKKHEIWVLLRECEGKWSSLLLKNEKCEVPVMSLPVEQGTTVSYERITEEGILHSANNLEEKEKSPEKIVKIEKIEKSPEKIEKNPQNLQNIVYSPSVHNESPSNLSKITEKSEILKIEPGPFEVRANQLLQTHKPVDLNENQKEAIFIQPTENYAEPLTNLTINPQNPVTIEPPSDFYPETSKDLLISFKPIFNMFLKKVMSFEKISEIHSKLIKKGFYYNKKFTEIFIPQECSVSHSFKKHLILDCFHVFCIECLFESVNQTSYFACPVCQVTLKMKTKVLIYKKVFKMYQISGPEVKKEPRVQKRVNPLKIKCMICLKVKPQNHFNILEKCKFDCEVCAECRVGSSECLNCKKVANQEFKTNQLDGKFCMVCNFSKENSSFDKKPCKEKCAVCFECRTKQRDCSICKMNESDSTQVTITKRNHEEPINKKCDSCGKQLNEWHFPPYCKNCQICISCILQTKKCFNCESKDIILYENRCPSCEKEIRTCDLIVPFKCHHFYHKNCFPKGKSSNCYACRHNLNQLLN